MPPPSRPKFEKRNHHYVPQFWLDRFRGPDGQLWMYGPKGVRVTSTSTIMAEDWLYTAFDGLWRPGDEVEDDLSRREGDAGRLYQTIVDRGETPDEQGWLDLCLWLALTACRHPKAMARGHQRAKALAFEIADVHAQSDVTFAQRLKAFGVHSNSAFHAALQAVDEATLFAEAEEIEGLAPQDPRLPALQALAGAPVLAATIRRMDLLVLEAASGSAFVLSDMPVPTQNLGGGFATPLSANVAVAALPAQDPSRPLRVREVTRPEIVELINLEQYKAADKVLVGPSRAILETLIQTKA